METIPSLEDIYRLFDLTIRVFSFFNFMFIATFNYFITNFAENIGRLSETNNL